MSRPRIRTLKPEMWEDEKIGDISRDARLLFLGLISLADDDGRFRLQPAPLIGKLFPEDGVAPSRFMRWLREITDQELVLLYEAGGKTYGVLPKWHKHQKINRYSPSELPTPVGIPHGVITERVVTAG